MASLHQCPFADIVLEAMPCDHTICGTDPRCCSLHDAGLTSMLPRLHSRPMGATDIHGAVQVSAECTDLLRVMLQADPAQRATVADVLRHPWVQHNMSPSLTAVNALLEGAHSPLLDIRGRPAVLCIVSLSSRFLQPCPHLVIALLCVTDRHRPLCITATPCRRTHAER